MFHSDLFVCLVWLFVLSNNLRYSIVVIQTTSVYSETMTSDCAVDNKRRNTTKNAVLFCKSVSLCVEENANFW